MNAEARIDLVCFEGCPHADQARENIRAAAALIGLRSEPVEWSEWDLMSDATPDSFRRHGSPTVLVDGRDVTGSGPGTDGMACRADGAPSPEVIAARLRQGFADQARPEQLGPR
jgi:hypothetical protein